MQVVKRYPSGVFSWVDLTSPDVEAAKAFYSGLFGWSFDDSLDEDGTLIYSTAKLEGYSVAGIGPMNEEMKAQNIPPIWISYVNHESVDEIAEKAAAAGGVVMFPPMDVFEEGRFTLIQDPQGASFGVWQPNKHIGAQLVNIPDTLVWNELQTPDVEGAKAFYAATFGWDFQESEGGYVSCKAGERTQAGMMRMDESFGDVPPNWSIYFLVEDVADKLARVEELGGRVIVPATPAGDIGKFAVISDPQGGMVSIIEYGEPPPPPPGY